MSILLALALTAAAATPPPEGTTSVRVLAFSDYHSHARPFRSEGRADQGGVARVIRFLREARRDPATIVVSGGDMLNKDVPTWSDEYRCVEWPWFDGLLDAMALGNHDLDYGAAAFAECRNSVRFPILSANLRSASGGPYLSKDGKPYVVKQAGAVRIGLFALAGPDVQRLIPAASLPRGTQWADATETARAVVRELRETERVDAVVFIGHQKREDDFAMARAVPGIDLILGTHSHHRSELVTISGTATHYIAPYQYLTYLSDVRLEFAGRRLVRVKGHLRPVNESMPEDATLAARVAQLQRELMTRRPERFAPVGIATRDLSDAGVSAGPAPIGVWATEVLRSAAGVHACFSTASSFRAAIGVGPVLDEDFRSAFPYPNKLARTTFTGAQLLAWVRLCAARVGSDGFCQQSGLRYVMRGDQPEQIDVLRDPARPEAGYAPLDEAASYTIATTDFQAYFLEGFKQAFAEGKDSTKTDLDVHTLLRAALATK